jgi:hypothetical protein
MKSPVLAPFDVALVCIGLMIAAIGLYRISPIPIGRLIAANAPLGIMALAFLGLMLAWYKPGGMTAAAASALARGGAFLPLVVILCAVMGMGAILAHWHEAVIQAFLVKHGVAGPTVMSFVTPTSNTLVPMIETAWKTESMRPSCLFYLQASAMVSVPLFMLRSTGFSAGSPLPLRMYVLGVIITALTFIFRAPLFWTVELVCRKLGS